MKRLCNSLAWKRLCGYYHQSPCGKYLQNNGLNSWSCQWQDKVGREVLIWAPSYSAISLKTFQSKPERMGMISSRYPDVTFFFCPDTSLWSSQSFLVTVWLHQPEQEWQHATALQDKMLGPEAPYLLLCWSTFVPPKIPSVIPCVLRGWSMLQLTGLGLRLFRRRQRAVARLHQCWFT